MQKHPRPPAFFGLLDGFPLREYGFRRCCLAVAIHMRMAANQFFGNAMSNILQVEGLRFAGDFRVEEDLQQDVA